MSRVVRVAVIVILTFSLLLLFWQFREAIVLFVLSLAVAAALRPIIGTFTGRKMPRRFALGIVYFLLVVGIISFFLLVSPRLFNDLQQAANDFLANYDRAKADWPLHGSVFEKALANQLPPSATFYQALTNQGGIPIFAGLFGFAQNFLATLSQIAFVLVLSLYWSADQFRFERLALSWIPEEYHSRALYIWRSVETGVGEYLRSEIVQSILAGFFLWLGYSVFGIRYPVLLALWGAFARLIPWFGALIAVLPALIIVIGNTSIFGVLATLYTIGILIVLELVIEPRFFPRYKYSSLLIVLFVIALAQPLGLIGVVLAPPLAVAVQILFQHLSPSATPAGSPEELEQARNIQERLRELRRRIQGPATREANRLIERLDRLINRVMDQLQEY